MLQSFTRRCIFECSYTCEDSPSNQPKIQLTDGIPYFDDVLQEREDYERIDQEADEWRARQIAKDIAKHKVLSDFWNMLFISFLRDTL
jgi:hypothetical protein